MKKMLLLAMCVLSFSAGCTVDTDAPKEVVGYGAAPLLGNGGIDALTPQAVAYVNLDGSLYMSAEAWNPQATHALALDVTKQDPGIYDVTAPLGVVFVGGHVTAQYTPGVTGVVESITDDITARVHLTDSTHNGADIDCAFMVSLW